MLRRSLVPLLALVLSPCATAQKKDPLEEAEHLLRSGEFPAMQGAQLCRTLNSKRSIELLLKLLVASQPHYRDIAWEGLPGFTDAEARKRVEQELRTNPSSDVQQWCVELLGHYADPVYGKTVQEFANSKDLDVLRAVARALGQMRYEPASKRLAELTASKDAIVRANAFEALARIQPEANQDRLQQALSDADGGVRTALLAALAEIYPELAEPRSIAMLTDGDWRVCQQAIDNLARPLAQTWWSCWLAGLPDPTPFLGAAETSAAAIEALVKATRNPRPLVAQHAQAVLRLFTGRSWTTASQWQGWWQARKDGAPASTGDRPGETPAAPLPSFFGLYVLSDHVAFLIDKSNDMNRLLPSEQRSKADAALDELEKTLAQLPDGIQCQVFGYAAEVTAFPKKPAQLTARERKAMVNFVRSQPNANQKDIWNALGTVMRDPSIDTVYLLSSGEPEIGLYVHYNRVTEHLRDLNRFHKVVIHAVSYTTNDWHRDQLRKIAAVTGGQFTAKD
ncbi:MAG: HEAT repeat domain-containing protein [Planctomycetota bacterium]